jgi:maltose phosphorylase
MMTKQIFEIDPWKITTHQLDKENRRLQESLTSLGNGYMGMRGNFEEAYSGDHHQGIYLAGVWYPDKTRVGWWKNGYPEYFGKVINALNFIYMHIWVDGEEIDLYQDEVKDFALTLDMEKGRLDRYYTVVKNGKEVTVHFTRFLSIDVKELCAIKVEITASADAAIRIESALDGNVRNEDANYEEMFWELIEQGEDALVVETIPNPFGVDRFTVAANMYHQAVGLEQKVGNSKDLFVSQVFEGTVSKDQTVSLEKYVTVTTSRDYPKDQVLTAAAFIHTTKVAPETFAALEAKQADLWAERWELADVVIGGNDEAQQGIRFNLFQLFSTYYGEDDRLNIGPKGFTGEKYGGATYWDTEAYGVPFYLALTKPEVTRNLLKYRHNQLPGAYHNAAQQGLKGALYPMVTFTGVECHNEWEITFEEIHRNGAIPYAIYNYTAYTGDESYLEQEGLEVLSAVSRFWADRVHFSQHKQCYMIHGVTGPNEYENNINNNWYTNKLAVWVLRYTLESLEKYPEREKALAITDAEKAKWQDIIARMYFPYDEERQVFVQHDTFLDKDLKPVSALDPAEMPLNQHWSWDKILRSCFIKQADVLQGIYLFEDEFTLAEKERNFDFYEPMTVHESSLSPCIHAILAAELKKEEKAVELYQRTARLDLDNYNNDTEDGLHITSMTGSWLTIAEGFAGMRAKDGLRFAPFLPKEWTHYQFHINYRGRLILIAVTGETVTLTLVKGEPLTVRIYEKEMQLAAKIEVAIKETVNA